MIQQTLRIASLMVLVLTSALTNLLQAQLSVSGTVTSHTDTPRNVEVVVFQGNTEVQSVTPKRRGKYSTSLELGYVYTLEFREAGAVTKRVTLDTRTEQVATEWAAALAAKSAEGELHYALDMKMHTLTPELAAGDDFEFPIAVLKWHEDGQFGPERNYVRVAGMTYEKARLVGVVR